MSPDMQQTFWDRTLRRRVVSRWNRLHCRLRGHRYGEWFIPKHVNGEHTEWATCQRRGCAVAMTRPGPSVRRSAAKATQSLREVQAAFDKMGKSLAEASKGVPRG